MTSSLNRPNDMDDSTDDVPARQSSPDGASGAPSTLRDAMQRHPDLERAAADAVDYYADALSPNTRRAYRSGWEDFCLFCDRYDLDALPAKPGTVALYLSFLAKKHDPDTGAVHKDGLVVPTLEQRLAAIRHVHREHECESPTDSRQVATVMRGIRRNQQHRPDRAPPLMTYHVKRMVDALPEIRTRYANRKRDRTKTASGAELTANERRYLERLQVRNRAMILLGFAGGLRRSEIAALRFESIRREPGLGLVVDVASSKTDADGEGYLIYVRRAESVYDPVRAYDRWHTEVASSQRDAPLDASDDERVTGPVFRAITRGGRIRDGAVTPETVNNVVKEAVCLADLPDADAYSAHSLRAGHATQATTNGVPMAIAMKTTRHQSVDQFEAYVRNDEAAFDRASSGKLGL